MSTSIPAPALLKRLAPLLVVAAIAAVALLMGWHRLLSLESIVAMRDDFRVFLAAHGLLSLLAAAVAMANTVSLATLERRQQIGVLKAVGLKGRRVLWVMLLENTLVGLLGGVLGIGISALGVALMTYFGVGDAVPIPADAMPLAIALIVASVLIAWGATFLSARVAVRERVANVLRYE